MQLYDENLFEGKTKLRVEILHDTIERFDSEFDNYYKNSASKNMRRWEESAKLCIEAPTIVCIEGDTLDVTQALTKMLGTQFACINMANQFFPGGGYTKGCRAQEENMFRRTNAHYTLTNDVLEVKEYFKKKYVVYTEEMQELISGVSGLVYINPQPLICIKGSEDFSEDNLGYRLLAKDEIFHFIELRSAAINVSNQRKRKRDRTIKKEMEKRIYAQFQTLVTHKIRHVVLSAFGCGAFGNDPKMVASIYHKCLEKNFVKEFDVVTFAIYFAGKGESNLSIFRSTLTDTKGWRFVESLQQLELTP